MNRFEWGLIALLGGSLLASGCAPLVVGGAATGASVAHDRRSPGTVLEDQNIEFTAYSRLSKEPGMRESASVSVTSYNRMVLLTGQAANEALKLRAAEVVMGVPEVKRVVNEIEIGSEATVSEEARDTYITSEAKLKLFNVKLPDFDPTRVKVVTERGVVHLMGLVRREEAEAAADTVRHISGVRRVVKAFEYIGE